MKNDFNIQFKLLDQDEGLIENMTDLVRTRQCFIETDLGLLSIYDLKVVDKNIVECFSIVDPRLFLLQNNTYCLLLKFIKTGRIKIISVYLET